MELDYLREYLVVASELNLTRAARQLSTSQSTLSKHLAALEREFGMQLLARTGKGFELTQAGAALFVRARTVVSEYDAAKDEVKRLSEMVSVQVGGMLRNGEVINLLSMLTTLMKERPDNGVRFSANPVEPFDGALRRKDLDLAICFQMRDARDAGFAERKLMESRLVAVVERSHPLAGLASTRFADLAAYPFVQLVSGYSNTGWQSISALCERHGFTPERYPVAVSDVVSVFSEPLGDAVLILSKSLFPGNAMPFGNYHIIDIEDDDAVFEICAYCRSEDEGKLAVFLDLLEEAGRRVQTTLVRPAAGPGPFQRRCRTLAERHGLNESETAALVSYAKGRSIDRIAEEMGLTRVMVGDLLASVFKRVGVRDKQELLDAIEALPAS